MKHIFLIFIGVFSVFSSSFSLPRESSTIDALKDGDLTQPVFSQDRYGALVDLVDSKNVTLGKSDMSSYPETMPTPDILYRIERQMFKGPNIAKGLPQEPGVSKYREIPFHLYEGIFNIGPDTLYPGGLTSGPDLTLPERKIPEDRPYSNPPIVMVVSDPTGPESDFPWVPPDIRIKDPLPEPEWWPHFHRDEEITPEKINPISRPERPPSDSFEKNERSRRVLRDKMFFGIGDGKDDGILYSERTTEVPRDDDDPIDGKLRNIFRDNGSAPRGETDISPGEGTLGELLIYDRLINVLDVWERHETDVDDLIDSFEHFIRAAREEGYVIESIDLRMIAENLLWFRDQQSSIINDYLNETGRYYLEIARLLGLDISKTLEELMEEVDRRIVDLRSKDPGSLTGSEGRALEIDKKIDPLRRVYASRIRSLVRFFVLKIRSGFDQARHVSVSHESDEGQTSYLFFLDERVGSPIAILLPETP